MTVREILKLLYKDGWYEIQNRTKGSHMQLKHPSKQGKVTVPAHSGDISLGTLKSIKKQAGIE